jgi:hypothetical protein
MSVAQLRTELEQQLAHTVPAAFEFRTRAPLHTLCTGSRVLDDALGGGGLPRGAMTEFHGTSGSGRTSAMYRVLAESTRRGELCALIDVNDAFSPAHAVNAGVVLSRVLWVRCSKAQVQGGKAGSRQLHQEKALSALAQALKCIDLVLRNGGFGLVVLDLADVSAGEAKRVPLTSWFRFRRAVEGSSTAFLVVAPIACAPTCSSAILQFERSTDAWSQMSHSPCGRALPGRWTPRTFAYAMSRLSSSVRAHCLGSGKRFSKTGDFGWG